MADAPQIPEVVNVASKLATFDDHWKPHIIGRYNGNEIRVVKIKDDFTWHAHPETDEMFLVITGEMGIEFRDGVRRFGAGEMVIVPMGVEHRPFADDECHILLIDKEGESNTGDTPSHRTRAKLETI